jgi:hypothetical protein
MNKEVTPSAQTAPGIRFALRIMIAASESGSFMPRFYVRSRRRGKRERADRMGRSYASLKARRPCARRTASLDSAFRSRGIVQAIKIRDE